MTFSFTSPVVASAWLTDHLEDVVLADVRWYLDGRDASEVDEARHRDLVLDARAPERFAGTSEPVDARAGHIPGARNAPWSRNLDPATRRFLGAGELRSRYEEVGATDAGDVVCYCGSGVT